MCCNPDIIDLETDPGYHIVWLISSFPNSMTERRKKQSCSAVPCAGICTCTVIWPGNRQLLFLLSSYLWRYPQNSG